MHFNTNNLSKRELELYITFLLKQNELIRKRIIRPIYRGESLANMCEKLNVENKGAETNYERLAEILFMVGDKSKRYFKDLDGFTLNDTDNSVFDKIMDYFNESIKNKNRSVQAFFENNSELKNFFSTKKNKKIFSNALKPLNIIDKLAVRNYYLILLHQISAINYRNKSHFVSASSNYDVAKKFSGLSKNKIDKIILHCWQPIKREHQIVQKCGLPTCGNAPYFYQKEITIFGGIFPHFISGLEITNAKRFFPNPNIFNNEITNDIFLGGLNINQSDFKTIIKKTNYKKSIVTDGTETWEENTI